MYKQERALDESYKQNDLGQAKVKPERLEQAEMIGFEEEIESEKSETEEGKGLAEL